MLMIPSKHAQSSYFENAAAPIHEMFDESKIIIDAPGNQITSLIDVFSIL